MPIAYEKARGPHLGDDIVWVDEPEDLYGTGPMVEQQRRHAAEVIKRMDSSTKWQRATLIDPDTISMVVGPDGATTSDGTPYAEAVSNSMEEEATKPEVTVESKPEAKSKPKSVAKPEGKTDRATQPQPKKPTQADVRAWATEQGLEVNPMGQVPKALVEKYIQAHGG